MMWSETDAGIRCAVQFNSVSARLKRAGMERSNASFVARTAEGDDKSVRLGQRIWIDPQQGPTISP